MKENKTKPKKILNKQTKKSAEKDLKIKITDRFTDVIKGLGHDSNKITKEIKKVSKLFSKKLLEKLDDLADSLESKNSKSKIKEAEALVKSQEKAKKIVVKANQKIIKEEKSIADAHKHIIPDFTLPAIPVNGVGSLAMEGSEQTEMLTETTKNDRKLVDTDEKNTGLVGEDDVK
jgi:predicted RND superfamily exporter protein